jgi:uncharacterized protein (TIGR00106 family)
MLAQVSILPLGKESGISEEVSRVIDLIDRSGLPYQLTAMGTIIEGEWREVMDLIGRCREDLLRDHRRIYMVIKIDEQPGRTGKLTGKVASVEKKLGRQLRK